MKNHKTGSSLQIISSDVAGSYGHLLDFLCCDEICHWKSRGLWDSMISAAAKRNNCCVVVISNAGFTESWQYKTYQAIKADPEWYVSELDGPKASWISEKQLESQQRMLPEPQFNRLWLNQWSSGSGDALDVALVDSAVRTKGPMEGTERGFQFIAALDLGIKRDRSAFVILGKNVGYTESIEPEQAEKKRDRTLTTF